MTTLKDPFSVGGEGSPEFGIQPGPAAGDAVVQEYVRPLAELSPVSVAPLIESPALPQVMPECSDDYSSLDFVQLVRAEVVYERQHEFPAAVDEIAALPIVPIVMPAHTDTAGSLDFVRVVQAEVAYERPSEPAPTVAPAPLPVPEPPVVEPSPQIDLPTPAAAIAAVAAPPAIAIATMAPAAAATFDPMPAPPLRFPAPTPAPAAKATRPASRHWGRRWARRAALALIGLIVGYTALVMALILAYRGIDPPLSTLMLELKLRGEDVDYRPVPLTSISSYLQRAVVTSEDARFCSHHGVDWGALAEAIQDSRGGSTITMQTAKNLFLWPSRSYIRKAIEIPIALTIDFAWPKRRILEIYLNIAEWGPGIFGAEAAAHYHFNKPASRLTPQEATLLAAVLPNPIARDAGDPGRVTELLASRLRGRMANSDAYVSCLGLRSTPRAEPARPAPRPSAPSASSKPAPTTAPWQTKTTKTEPAKPETPAFNPWQN